MSAFTNTDELQTTMVELWNAIKSEQSMSTKLLNSKLVVLFRYREPDGMITIDCRDGKQFLVYSGDVNIKPEIEMSMRSEVAHEFWLGKVNVPVALLTGKIMAKGPVNKALALLPVLKPAFELYPEIYKRHHGAVSSKVSG